MTDATLPGWFDLVRSMPGLDRPLKVLVLGDPGARMCRALAAAGHSVTCCPDRQALPGGSPHVDIRHPTVVDLIGQGPADLDLVVAVDGWQRLRRVNVAPTVDALLEWMRTSAALSAVQAPRRVLAPDLNELGPFAVLPELGVFSFLAESSDDAEATPIVLCSDRALLATGEWIVAESVTWVDSDAPDARIKPVRTYVVGDRVVKVEFTSEDYFERAQLVGEAAFLGSLAERQRSVLGLPPVRSLVRGRAVATLVRDQVTGGPAPDLARQMDGVLDIAAGFAAEGIFHNDVRPWNVLWDGPNARLIDFADSSSHDDDVRDLPQVLALAGTLASIATDEIRDGEHFHDDVLGIASVAGLLDQWPLTRQLTDPWLALPARRSAIDVRPDATASEIMRSVLEVACA